MENTSGRRDVLKNLLGIASLSAFTSASFGSLPRAQAAGSEVAAANSMLWSPFTPRQEDVARFATEASRDLVPNAISGRVPSDPFSALMSAPLSGLSDTTGLAILGMLEETGTVVTHKNRVSISVTLFGWRINGSIQTSKLPGCVNRLVKHFLLRVYHKQPDGQWKLVLRAQLGAYRNEAGTLCFVLRENVHFDLCWKICSPTYSDLIEMFKWLIAAAAAVAGVIIVGWVVFLIAVVAAAVYYFYLLDFA